MLAIKKRVLKIYMNKVLKKERVYVNKECSVKHLLIRNNKSDKLLVVFSGFPEANKSASYNYVLKFRDLQCNKLFILDDTLGDPRGIYYLGKDRNLFIQRAIGQLIENVSEELNVTKSNIITSGSSKGGYAALYFSYKYNYGTAIVGAPQVLLGNYLNHELRSNILNYIAGGVNQEDVEYLNSVLLDTIKESESSPETYIHVSKNEHHYEGHVKHLTKLLEELGRNYDLDLGTYKKHGDVGIYFSPYARSIIQDKLK